MRYRCCAPTTAVRLSCNKSSAVAEMGDRLATVDMGRKWGGAAVPLSVGRAGSPSNTMSPGPRPTSVPSSILIHPTDCHNTPTLLQTNKTGQDITGQRSRSIGRTVTCNGRPLEEVYRGWLSVGKLFEKWGRNYMRRGCRRNAGVEKCRSGKRDRDST